MPQPVARAEEFYLPPPATQSRDWTTVPPAERAWRWVELRQQRRLTPPDGTLIGQRLYAKVNHNRWVADCPCGSAQVVTPADPRFACPECGYGWVPLVFPENPEAVEALLSKKLPHERNWWHDEDPHPWGRPPAEPRVDPRAEPTRGPTREVTP